MSDDNALYEVTYQAVTNADWVDSFDLRDDVGAWDLNGATFAMKLKASPTSNAVLELTTGNGRIVIEDASAGRFKIHVPASVMATVPPATYRHDMLMTLDGVVHRLMYGEVRIGQGIT